jgi:hypothetical protein
MRRMVSGEMPRTSPSSCSLRASSAESKVASGSEQHSQVFRRPTCSRAMRLPVAIHLAQTRQRLRGAPIQRRSLDPCRDDPYHAYSLGTNPDLRPFHTASNFSSISKEKVLPNMDVCTTPNAGRNGLFWKTKDESPSPGVA